MQDRIQEIKSRATIADFEQFGNLQKDRHDNKKYICPFCNSGNHGAGSTGAGNVYKDKTGVFKYFCFSCEKQADIIDIYQQATGKDTKDAINELADFYGIRSNAEPKRPQKNDKKESESWNLEPLKAEFENSLKFDVADKYYFEPFTDEYGQLLTYRKDRYYRNTGGKAFAWHTFTQNGIEVFYTNDSGKPKCGQVNSKAEKKDNLPLLFIQGTPTKIAFVCEGEKDAVNLAKLGAFAVSTAYGYSKAVKWDKSFSERLKKDSVQLALVLVDNDKNGQVGAEIVAKRLIQDGLKVKLIDISQKWQEAPAKADISDALQILGVEKVNEILQALVKEIPLYAIAPKEPEKKQEQNQENEIDEPTIYETEKGYFIAYPTENGKKKKDKQLTNYFAEIQTQIAIKENGLQEHYVRTKYRLSNQNESQSITIDIPAEYYVKASKYKEFLNQKAGADFTNNCVDANIQIYKDFLIAKVAPLKKVQGVITAGIKQKGDNFIYVEGNKAVNEKGELIDGIMQLDEEQAIISNLIGQEPITKEEWQKISSALFDYNDRSKTITAIAWACGCFIKEHLRLEGIKTPHLCLWGEAGSGKSTTLEKIILPLLCTETVISAGKSTTFSRLKSCNSSNLAPYALDEYKPSRMAIQKVQEIEDFLRNSYDNHIEQRGRADQSIMKYKLLSPVILVGEESPHEPAIADRTIILQYSKKTHSNKNLQALLILQQNQSMLNKLGKSLLLAALNTKTVDVVKWYEDGLYSKIVQESTYTDRIKQNMAYLYAGLYLLDKTLKNLGTSLDIECGFNLTDGLLAINQTVFDDTTESGLNKSLVVETLEFIADRLQLTPDQKSDIYESIDEGKKIGIRLNLVYDLYTAYRKIHDIKGECLDLKDFKRQLKQTDFCIDISRLVRRKQTQRVEKMAILDMAKLRAISEIETFLK